MQPTEKEISDFLTGFEKSTAIHLANDIDPARVVSLVAFHQFACALLPRKLKVAVVSGDQEPELLMLSQFEFEIDYFNWSPEDTTWDLNSDWSDGRLNEKAGTYDLVLCEQVLEHLWDPYRAVSNLSYLIRPGGYLHLNTPALCGFHGSPHYFYAGFHPEVLKVFASEANMKIIESDAWQSTKAVRMYSICDWAPLTISGGSTFKNIRPASSFRSKLRAIKHGNTWQRQIRLHNRYYSDESLFDQVPTQNVVISWLIAQKPH